MAGAKHVLWGSILAASVLVLAGCESSQTGFTPSKPPQPTEAKDGKKGRSQDAQKRGDAETESLADTGGGGGDLNLVELSCEDTASGAAKTVTHRGRPFDEVRIKADWCVEAKKVGKLRLLFLVDASGSMKTADPIVSGSCGRLDAVKAVAAKAEAALGEADDAEVAVVVFGTRAQVALDFAPLDAFKAKLKADVFCQAIDQTDYEEAFDLARDLIESSVTGKSVPVTAYLLSDGLPSKGTEKSAAEFEATESAAVEAARKLRDANVSLSAVYLEVKKIAGTTDPKEYLTKVTGSADKVRVVTDASELEASITELELPIAEVDPATATAKLETQDDQKTVQIDRVEQSDDQTRVTVETVPFRLLGARGETVRNVVKVSLEAGDGTLHHARVVFDYEME